MQYDNYELKIKKVEKFFKAVFRNLPKIIACFAVVTVAVIALLATRGTITAQAEGYTAEIVYGDDLEYTAKAFLSKVEYEYSKQGSDDWSSEFPTQVGIYQVRAKAKATFGYRYGNVETFAIQAKPIDVEIASKTVVYGDSPEVSAKLKVAVCE